MTTVVADSNLKKVLAGIKDVAEILDDQGNVLGLFTPELASQKAVYEEAKRLFDPQELERRKLEQGGSTFDQIVAHVKTLEGQQ